MSIKDTADIKVLRLKVEELEQRVFAIENQRPTMPPPSQPFSSNRPPLGVPKRQNG